MRFVVSVASGVKRLFQSLSFKIKKLWNRIPGKNPASRVASFIFYIITRALFLLFDFITSFYLPILNLILVRIMKRSMIPNSVLHISHKVHIPYYMTRILRRHGVRADYLALGDNTSTWGHFDFLFPRTNRAPFRFEEFLFFWRVVAKYEVIHSHFGLTLSSTGWEFPLLKQMGRRIIVHYRGCEARNQARNMELHPVTNICQECDYNGMICRVGATHVALAQKYGDTFLVTTPDMKDFMPDAIYFPFFLPEVDYEKYKAIERPSSGRPFKIVHATNHPGIEGTRQIQFTIDALRAKGYDIDFVFLKGVEPEKILKEIQIADLTIGKMKMGYYANTQIESMFLGVPAVTHVRTEFMTHELEESGFIFSSLSELESILEYYINNPAELAKKRAKARSSILRLHDEKQLIRSLLDLYGYQEGLK